MLTRMTPHRIVDERQPSMQVSRPGLRRTEYLRHDPSRYRPAPAPDRRAWHPAKALRMRSAIPKVLVPSRIDPRRMCSPSPLGRGGQARPGRTSMDDPGRGSQGGAGIDIWGRDAGRTGHTVLSSASRWNGARAAWWLPIPAGRAATLQRLIEALDDGAQIAALSFRRPMPTVSSRPDRSPIDASSHPQEGPQRHRRRAPHRPVSAAIQNHVPIYELLGHISNP